MEGTGRSGGSDRTINARTPVATIRTGQSASLLCGHLASGNMNPGDPGKAGRDSGSKATVELEIQRAPGTHPGARANEKPAESRDNSTPLPFLWFATVLVPRHCNSAAPTNISKSRDCFTLIVVDEVSGRAAWNRIELPSDDGPDFESGTSAIVVVLETRCGDT